METRDITSADAVRDMTEFLRLKQQGKVGGDFGQWQRNKYATVKARAAEAEQAQKDRDTGADRVKSATDIANARAGEAYNLGQRNQIAAASTAGSALNAARTGATDLKNAGQQGSWNIGSVGADAQAGMAGASRNLNEVGRAAAASTAPAISSATQGVNDANRLAQQGAQQSIQALQGAGAQNASLQNNALSLSQAAAQGNAPSVAQIQQQRAFQDAAKQQLAMAAAARGGGANLAAAQRNAALQGSELMGQSAQANAMLRAQEMATARDQFGQLAGAARGQDLSQAGQMSDAAARAGQLGATTALQGAATNLQGGQLNLAGQQANIGALTAGSDALSKGYNTNLSAQTSAADTNLKGLSAANALEQGAYGNLTNVYGQNAGQNLSYSNNAGQLGMQGAIGNAEIIKGNRALDIAQKQGDRDFFSDLMNGAIAAVGTVAKGVGVSDRRVKKDIKPLKSNEIYNHLNSFLAEYKNGS